MEQFQKEKLPAFLKKEDDLLEKLSEKDKRDQNFLQAGKQTLGGEIINSQIKSGITDAAAKGQRAKAGDIETKGKVTNSILDSGISYRKS